MTVQVTRRSVTRGAAWAAPVLAMSVAAPAFASSGYTPPVVTKGDSNKCPGSGSPYTYNLGLNVVIAGPTAYTIEIVSVTPVGPAGVEAHTLLPPLSTNLPVGGGAVVVRFSTSNSRSSYVSSVTYRVRNTATGVLMGTHTTSLGDVKYGPRKNGDIGYC